MMGILSVGRRGYLISISIWAAGVCVLTTAAYQSYCLATPPPAGSGASHNDNQPRNRYDKIMTQPQTVSVACGCQAVTRGT
ncbi:hypothetical protein BJX61DRAFT_515522 [Aspergillus egyptiacus]|nr:hypothetical protein BJX61DRAFT_515522 [Aspergillus egyptiacus]